MPLVQAPFPAHARPQTPQFVELVSRLASQPFEPTPSQSANGDVHTTPHCAALHTAVSFGPGDGHGVLHAPQWATLVLRSTQSAPHVVSGHAHCPAMHVELCVPELPHEPQFRESTFVSVQNAAPPVPHAISLPGQKTQLPFSQS